MSSVVSFKVPREIKEKMKKLKKHVKWSEELRNFLIKRVEEVEREVNMREAVEMLKKTRGVPKGYAVALVREDRDRS
jgi:predicted DNA-binding protein